MLDDYAQKLRERLESDGEDKVLRDIGLGKYGGKRRAIVDAWLQERKRWREAEIEARTDASQAAHLEAAISAATAAREAAASARVQADEAREANRLASNANTIATAAVIVAVIAIAISIVALIVSASGAS